MSYGYGGRANPYAQQDSPTGYGSPAPQGGYNGGYGQSVEMAPLSQSGAAFGTSDPNAILNECRDIGKGIDRIQSNLDQLRMLQDRSLNETDSAGSATTRQLDQLSSETMSLYRGLVEQVRTLKGRPDSQSPKNKPQVDRIERRLRETIQSYQQVEANFRHKMQDQMERQYRIVRPDASEDEVRAAVDDMSTNGQQVFQQAMMQSNRSGQARAVLDEVRNRHQELLKIESQIVELAQLFQDLDTLIVQQEEEILKVEENAEQTVVHLDEGNKQIDKGIEIARGTRKKKWICLGICVLIVVIIVVAVVVYYFVTHPSSGNSNSSSSSTKRSIVQFAGERPVSAVYAQSKIVEAPGINWKANTQSFSPLSKFAGATRRSIAGRLSIPVEEGIVARSDTLPVAMDFDGPN